MFSLIFFGFVFFILLAGFFAVTMMRKKRASSEANRSTEGNKNMPRTTGVNEPSANDIKGVAVPADNKLSLRDLNSPEQMRKDEYLIVLNPTKRLTRYLPFEICTCKFLYSLRKNEGFLFPPLPMSILWPVVCHELSFKSV